MINGWFIAAALLLAPSPAYAQTAASDTVDVAAPTGEKDIDRASILAALDQVGPGGTIRFAPGTYLIGEIIHVTVPGISVVGHPLGTTLRGCHPDMFPRQAGWEEMFVAVVSCNGLDMAGGHQTVRGLTFEYAWHALVLGGMECIEGRGCVPVLQPVESRPGGYRVEDNTFRSTANGIRTLGQWSDPAVIRGNRFINTFHAVVVHGSIVHVVKNDISVPEPERVPSTGHPGVAMSVSATDLNLEAVLLCAGNVIAGNRISGHPDGIAIRLFRAGVSCRDNVIRGNTVAVERVKVPASWEITLTESDSSVVGVPIALINEPKADPEVFGSAAIDEQEGMLEGNLIEGNTISGAEGIGIELVHASGNRIVNNTITRVARRDPFPGITMNSFDPQKSGWREANGSAIWVSPGSDENEFLDNTFDDIASHAIVLAGDRNHVELQSADDTVRDLGSNNRVVRPDGQTGSDAPHPYPSRFVDAGGVRTHYLDFGGEGLRLVFVHSEGWDAHTYEDFAPRLTDAHRVLAVTRPGYGESEAHPEGFHVAAQAKSLIDFLDALGIERAVFAGNSSPTVHLTYLAEHHPDRVAGVIYLAGLLTHWLGDEVRESDPTGARAMAERASEPDATASERLEALLSHRPEFLAGDRPPIEVPALAFVGRSGTIGHERFSEPLALVGSALMADFFAELPPSPFRDYFQRLIEDPDFRSESLRAVEDSAAREFLLRLAEDTELQAEVWRYQMETARPAVLAGQERFRRAFSDRLRLVRLDVSTVSGYEYRDSPELIEPHIRRFLADLEPIHRGSQDTHMVKDGRVYDPAAIYRALGIQPCELPAGGHR